MNTAIYMFYKRDTECPSCNQAGSKMMLSDVEACKKKATEIYGEDQHFTTYADTDDTLVESKYLKGAKVRRRMEQMLEDIEQKRIDMLVVTYMGAIAADFMFILALYIYLRQHQVKLLTVREGERINDMLEKALDEFTKKSLGEQHMSFSEAAKESEKEETMPGDSTMTTIFMEEIDGSTREIAVYEAPEGFLHLKGCSLAKCEEMGLKLYKDQAGEFYLADGDRKVVAMNIVTIKTYINYLVK